jgi:serralysin
MAFDDLKLDGSMPAVESYNPTGDAYIDGILGNRKWAVSNFTFSFPANASFYGSSYGNGETASQFEGLNATQQTMARHALSMYASVANLGFTEISETAIRHADFRLAMSDKPSTAWAYFPSTNASGGDAWFNNSKGHYDNPMKGNYASATFIHEIGHALGLEHPHELFIMPQDRDSMEYTIMSYRSYAGASTTAGYLNENWGYAQSLMMYDIAAVQYLYGADYSTNSGDTTYSWSPTTGEAYIDGAGQGIPGANRIFQTIWDGDGTDTYDLSRYATGVNVDLRPGGWTTTSAVQLAKLHYSGSKVAAGNIANALLHDDQTRSIIENAIGGSGNDTLTGNQAANSLKGGAGNDTLDGGAGSDTVVFEGHRSQFGVTTYSNGSIQVTDLRPGMPDGQDTVWNAEWFLFVDKIYSTKELAASAGFITLTAANTQEGSVGNDKLYGTSGKDRLYGHGGNDVLNGGAGGDRLDGGSGIDSASYTAAAKGVLADLGYASSNKGEASGDTYVSVERLIGSIHADSLRGNNAANAIKGSGGNDTLVGREGNDVLDGGLGNDRLFGQAGRDILIGGSGHDIFVFRSASESRGPVMDTIRDFVPGVDRIDLRAMDANAIWSGNQAFTFIGKAPFSGKAGQLSFSGGIVSGDMNGDQIADFQIRAIGVSALTKADFYL